MNKENKQNLEVLDTKDTNKELLDLNSDNLDVFVDNDNLDIHIIVKLPEEIIALFKNK